jgi:hypothetical protein
MNSPNSRTDPNEPRSKSRTQAKLRKPKQKNRRKREAGVELGAAPKGTLGTTTEAKGNSVRMAEAAALVSCSKPGRDGSRTW